MEGEREMKISGEERKKQILQVARGLCAEKGFAGTTLDDMAEGAGVSRALIIQHFGSKEGVYDALAEFVARVHPLEDDSELQQKIRENDDYGVFHACASHVFEHSLSEGSQSNQRLTVFSMLENPTLFGRYAHKRNKAWDGVVAYVERRQQEGAFRAVDARRLVEGFRNMVVHLAAEVIHRQECVDSQDFYGVVDTVIDVILAGIALGN